MHEPLHGADVLRQLEAGYQRLRDSAVQIDARLKQLEIEGQDNLRRRGDSLVELARLYLPDLERDTVESTFRDVRGQLRELLVAKQQRQRALQREWDSALDDRQKSEAQLERVTEQLDALVSRREQLEEELVNRLRSEEEFQQLSAEALSAEQTLARNVERVEESRQEAAEKLPAYNNSRLFQYLAKRGYGTPGYQKSVLTRTLDGWVARLVDYDKAKRSYDFLRNTPELMSAEVERRRGEFDQLMQRVDAIEERVSGEIGLTDVLLHGVEVGAERDAAVERLEKIEAEQERVGDEIRRLDASQGEFHQQAVERMKRFLGTMRESALEAHALATADPEDDKLMDEIRWLNDRLEEARAESEDLHPQLAATRRRESEFGQMLRRFRRAEFDSYRSTFESQLDVPRLLDRYLDGRSTADELWDALQSHQRFEPTWAEREWGDREWEHDGRSGRSGEFSYVLMHVLAEAAGAAIRHASEHHARKQGRDSEPWRPPPSVRRSARGGFTRGEGF